MRRLILALVLAGVALVPLLARAETLRLGDRFYDIALPADPKGAPLILALHGGGGSPAQFARSSGLGVAAVAAGFAVAFPAGSGRGGDRLLTWNGGYCCGHAMRQGVDDLAFLRDVVRDAADRFGLDGSAVFVTGMSNGAILAETFAAREPTLVRAVAGVAGTMDTARVTVAGPVPALIIHGTADRMVPYLGGQGDKSLTRTDFAPVAAVVEAFLAPWGGGLSAVTRSVDRVADGTSVTISDHRKDGRIVLRLITVEGGAHHWPGGRKARLDSGKTREIDANAEILRFFAAYR
jgi:polyhydroxybutyrate depolymerase